MKSQRDTFIDKLFDYAKNDKDVVLLSVDMGAPSLDRWREELPDQFIAMGISEQHSINFASGLAQSGKKVYVYYMAAWSARCFEQIRYSCAMAGSPVTILGNGVALGYAPSGPAHCPNEDIAYMRSLCGMEIYAPSTNDMVEEIVKLTYEKQKLRYIRLERHAPMIDGLHGNNSWDASSIELGMDRLLIHDKIDSKQCIISAGYMLGRAVAVARDFSSRGTPTDVVDMWKIKNVDKDRFRAILGGYDLIVTLEEQTLDGGFGSLVCENLADLGMLKRVLRIGLPERYIFENGFRDHLLDTNGLSVDDICTKIKEFK